jgi:hypothetical protein
MSEAVSILIFMFMALTVFGLIGYRLYFHYSMVWKRRKRK